MNICLICSVFTRVVSGRLEYNYLMHILTDPHRLVSLVRFIAPNVDEMLASGVLLIILFCLVELMLNKPPLSDRLLLDCKMLLWFVLFWMSLTTH